MLSIPLKNTAPVDVVTILETEILRSVADLPEYQQLENTNAIQADIQSMSSMRTDVMKINGYEEQTFNDNITSYKTYLGALFALSKRFSLDNAPFPWTNSISLSNTLVQGRGIWFEIINLLFNQAALLTQEGASIPTKNGANCYMEAAGILQFAIDILPQVGDQLPAELEKDVLQFLYDLCLTEAYGFQVEDSGSLWDISIKFLNLSQRMGTLPQLQVNWKSSLKSRSKYLASLSCLKLAKSLHRSRKHSDQVLQKAALIKCIELNGGDEIIKEANNMLHEPLNRRSSFTLNDLDEVTAFIPANYFSTDQSGYPKYGSIPYSVPQSKHFANLLPSNLLYAPYVLHHSFSEHVESLICDKLLELNHNTLSEIVISNIPVIIEINSRPNSIPECIYSILETVALRIKQAVATYKNEKDGIYIHPLYHRCKNTLSCCEKLASTCSKGEYAIETSSLGNTITNLRYIFDVIEKNENLCHDLFILLTDFCQNIEKDVSKAQLAEFLAIPPNFNSNKQRSKPMFLEKAQLNFSKINENMKNRVEKLAEIRKKVLSIDFKTRFIGFLEANATPPSKINKDIVKEFQDSLITEFKEDIEYVHNEEKVALKQISAIKDLKAQFESYSRYPTRNLLKENAAQSLMATAAKWLDIDNDLNSLYRKLSMLEFALTTLSDENSFEVTDRDIKRTESTDNKSIPKIDRQGEKLHFAWRPGMAVNIFTQQ